MVLSQGPAWDLTEGSGLSASVDDDQDFAYLYHFHIQYFSNPTLPQCQRRAGG